jgi:two-component system aerobic respiration control protein ArcA
MSKKRIHAKDFIKQIESITKSRMASQEVVELGQFREISAKKQEQKTILVIEDDDTMRASLKRILEVDRHNVVLVSDGTELGSVLENNSPDLILMDVGLPWINGFEIAKMMKEHSELSLIPLVFVSGSNSADDIRQAKEIGADDYIKKPFEVEKLRRTVLNLLKLEIPSELA